MPFTTPSGSTSSGLHKSWLDHQLLEQPPYQHTNLWALPLSRSLLDPPFVGVLSWLWVGVAGQPSLELRGQTAWHLLSGWCCMSPPFDPSLERGEETSGQLHPSVSDLVQPLLLGWGIWWLVFQVVLLRTVKAAYMHINCMSINIWHGKLNCKFLMNPWQYKHGVCNNDNNDVCQFCK